MDVRQITPDDVALLYALRQTFAEAFEDSDTYARNAPDETYLRRLLASEAFIALAALEDGAVVGGITAYELSKFEQERSEIYLYDLAVASTHRRKGVANALIETLKAIARVRGAYVVFVQTGAEEAPAIALYSRHGPSESIAHFEFAVSDPSDAD